MSLRAATPADFAFIRGLAGHPDYAPFITDEDETALAAYLTDPEARLYIWDENGTAAGFALYCEIGHPTGRVELRRLALARTGGGRGLAFVTALTDHAFGPLNAARVWLDASGENTRAAKVYDQAGYRLEGTLRAHWWRPALGRSVDLLLYGILRDEWQARRG
ncbi:GNAT family N-acetyltransferase [Tabrizicola sp.]|uniref:GNAT family N-acetyltransferase n=1 Tax=Tabrizicola sp. TaxID=2005166 RepID=UPI003D2D8EAF